MGFRSPGPAVRFTNLFLILLAAALIVQAVGHRDVHAQAPTADSANIPPPRFKSVLVVLDENHGYTDVINNPNMPFLNSVITQFGLATNFYADAHPSIGNYFMLTTGKILTTNDANTRVFNVPSVVRSLKAAGLTWKGYYEDLPQPNPLVPGTFPYIQHHDPFVFIKDVVRDPVEQQNLVDFSEFSTDLQNGTLPNYAFIVPNAIHQAHDPDPNNPGADPMANCDKWLQANIRPVLSTPDFLSNNILVILTWDEANQADKTHGGGHVATVIASNKSKPGFQSTRLYRHQSTLRLMLEALGVRGSKLPGASRNASEMGEFFN